jgi:hypothetical protein
MTPVGPAGLPRVHAPEPMPEAVPAPDGSPQSVDLVLADLTDTAGAPMDGRLGMLAAGMLRGGGVLAVLSRVRHSADGVLVDATGGIVASAQNADLLYLRHVVIPAQPLRPARATDAVKRQAPDLSTVHEVAHVDLVVFARPRFPGSSRELKASQAEPGGVRASVWHADHRVREEPEARVS